MEKQENLARFLAQRLRHVRLARGLTQKDLQDRGISYKYYQRIEAGRVNLTLRSVEKLAAALEIRKILDLFQRPSLRKEILRDKTNKKS